MEETQVFDYDTENEIEYLETIRLKNKRLNTLGKILLIPGTIFMVLRFENFIFLTFLGFFLTIISILLIAITNYRFKSEMSSSELFQNVVQRILPEATIDVENGLDELIIDESGLEKLYNRYSSDFLVSGTYNNVTYSCSNVLIQHHTSNGKSSSTRTMFKGVVYEMDFEKDIDVCLKVFEKKDTHLKSGLSKIEMESIAFNEKFKTYTNDEQNCYYILTPLIQEMMLKMEETFPGKVEFSYTNGKMFIGIESNKVGFNFSLKNSIAENFDYIENQFRLIHSFIDAFKLSTSKFTNSTTIYKQNEYVTEYVDECENEYEGEEKKPLANGWD